MSYSTPVAVDASGVLAGRTLTQNASTDDHTCAEDTEGLVYCSFACYLGEQGSTVGVLATSPVAVDTSGVLSGKAVTLLGVGRETWVVRGLVSPGGSCAA